MYWTFIFLSTGKQGKTPILSIRTYFSIANVNDSTRQKNNFLYEGHARSKEKVIILNVPSSKVLDKKNHNAFTISIKLFSENAWVAYAQACADPNICSEGVKLCNSGKFWFLFFIWLLRGGRILISLKWVIIDPPAKRHLNGVSLGCRWWLTLNAGLVALQFIRESGPLLLRNHMFVIFQWGGGRSGPPVPLWINAWNYFQKCTSHSGMN